jgi:aminomethyltransferase
MTLERFHHEQGAALAPDGIPLHFGDQPGEYHAALQTVVLMDRSHEGRLQVGGRDRFALIQRMSTNDVEKMPAGTGRPTILTNPNGRIIDRLMIYRHGEQALITTEPGRGEAVQRYLQSQVFFNDDFHLSDLGASTRLFALHGPQADAVVETLTGAALKPETVSYDCIAAHNMIFARRKGLIGGHWAIIVPNDAAESAWLAIMGAGAAHGLRAAGSLTYNVLRIQAGRPGVGRELSEQYIPLEAGLWDEVSFSKGCYTGQEIIARMESRSRLAKTMVQVHLSQMINAPAPLLHEGKEVGTLTSSVEAPDGQRYGIGFVRVAHAVPGQMLTVGSAQAEIAALAGAQPPQLSGE